MLQELPVEGEDGITPHSHLSSAEPAPLEQSAVIIFGPTANTLKIKMMMAFVDYLRSVDALFMPRFSHAHQSNQKSNRHTLYLIQNNLEHNCPFHKSIPSHAHILRHDTIFAKALIHTKAGFFNALIFILVLYRAPALYETQGHFNNLVMWEAFCEDHAKEKDNWF